MQRNKKIIFLALALLVIGGVTVLWFLVLSQKETIDIKGDTVAPSGAEEAAGDFLEFPKEARPLLQHSLDESLKDIEALEF